VVDRIRDRWPKLTGEDVEAGLPKMAETADVTRPRGS